MITKAVLEQARKYLERRATNLHGVSFENVVRQDFSFEEIRAGFSRGAVGNKINPLLDKGDSSAAIYRLSVKNQAGAQELRDAFDNYKVLDGHKLPRKNDVNDSNIVYVGSSQKIKQRLQQHLNKCGKDTYALKMHLWCPDTVNSITVEVATVRGNVEATIIQDIEDTIWRNSRPMFGKIGRK